MRRSDLALGLLLVVGAVLTHAPALSAGFLWDDALVTANPAFASGDGLARIWTDPHVVPIEQHFWPVTYTSFWIEARLWGLGPAGLHATNVALHALNALLLWGLLRRFGARAAWWGAALFAVHPVHVESVAWVIERKDVLSAAFYLVAAHALVAGEASPGRGGRRAALVALGCCAFVLAAWSKAVALTLPIALALALWARDGALRRRTAVTLAALFVGAVVLGAFDLARATGADPLADLDWSLSERIRIAGEALTYYARTLVAPVGLTPVVPWFHPERLVAWLHPIGWGLLAVLLALGRRRLGRWPLAVLGIWAATLAPMLGLVPFSWMRSSFVADRFQYLASASALALAAAAGARALERTPAAVSAVLGSGVLVVLAALGHRYADVFSHAPSHARRIVATNPDSWVGHFNLGTVLREEGELGAALAEFDRSAELRPGFAATHNNRGDLLMSLGRVEEAERALRVALELDPDLASAHGNLGILLTNRGSWEEARRHLDRALELRPDVIAFRLNLGLLFAKSGRLDEAREVFEGVLADRPDDPVALRSLATLRRLGAGD